MDLEFYLDFLNYFVQGLDQAAARAKTKLPDSKPFSLKYKAKGVSDGGFQSLKGSEEGDGSGHGVNFSIDPSRQGAFAINEPPGEEALVVIDPVTSIVVMRSGVMSSLFSVGILSGSWDLSKTASS